MSNNASHRNIVLLMQKMEEFNARLVKDDILVANYTVHIGDKKYTTDDDGLFSGELPLGTYIL